MADQPASLPNTLAECHALLQTQQATIDQQQEVIDQQQEVLKALQREVALLKRAIFGRRRERFEDPDQQLLFDSIELDAEEAEKDEKDEPDSSSDDDDDPPKPRRRRGRVRRVFPEFLPRVQRIQELDEADIPEHLRGQEGRRFKTKVGEWLEWEPPQLRVVEEFIETLAIDNADATETEMVSASREPRILSCFAGPSLLASIGVSRFADHLPYYRFEEILQRSGITIDRATQCRWMISIAFVLVPLIERMRQLVLESSVVRADETPVKMLAPGQGETTTSYLWAVLGDEHPYTTFYFSEDRSRAGPEQFFSEFDGFLVSDAYIVYESLSKESQDRIRLAGCHVHARRKFEELHTLGPTKHTSTALGYFQRLFDMEDEWQSLTPEERYVQRQARAAPLMAEFKTWLDEQLATLRPKHELRGAITYMTSRWGSFVRFLESGSIPIHNNDSERAVKNPVVGKKAWLFFGAPRGGETAAAFYTLTATCRRLHIDPHAYLKDLFERFPRIDVENMDELDRLLPDRWLAENPKAKLSMRAQESDSKAQRKRNLRTRRRKALAQQAASR